MADEKQLRDDIDKALAEMERIDAGGVQPIEHRLMQVGIVQAKICCLADIISRRNERITKWLVRLTWALFFLTFVLLIFTIAIYEDAHLQIQRETQTQNH